MDVPGLLSSAPVSALDADVRGYLQSSLAALGAAEAAELLAPFLAEAELANDAEMLGMR